jgi:hypothetical protein
MTTGRHGAGKCQSTTQAGKPCGAPAIAGSSFCFFHDGEKAEERHQAQAAGGRQSRAKSLGSDAPTVKVEDSHDIVRLLNQTINEVRRGELDPKIANAVGYLSAIALRAMEQGDLEERVAQLESALRNPRPAAPTDEEGRIPA